MFFDLITNLPSTLELAATARGGVLITSSWIAKVVLLEYHTMMLWARHPVPISIAAAFMPLYCELLHIMPIWGANWGSGNLE